MAGPRKKKIFQSFKEKKAFLFHQSKKAKEKVEKAQQKIKLAQRQEEIASVPRSLVFSRGDVGPKIRDLISDFQNSVMMPYTAKQAKVSPYTTVKEICGMAQDIWVSHLMVFRVAEHGLRLRIVRLPQGPTLTFRVLEYTPSKDLYPYLLANKIPYSEAHPRITNKPPLVVMSGFNSAGEGATHLKLCSTTFQNLFPPIDVDSFDLKMAQKRCLLFQYDKATDTISMRQYHVDVQAVSKEEQHKQKVQLKEMGPRLTMQLEKIEEGIMAGEVLHHAFVKKSTKEILDLRYRHDRRKKEKQERREEQEKNVQAKKDQKTQKQQQKESKKQAALKQMEDMIDGIGEEQQPAAEDEDEEQEPEPKQAPVSKKRKQRDDDDEEEQQSKPKKRVKLAK